MHGGDEQLGAFLLEAGVVTRPGLEEAMQLATTHDESLATALVKTGHLTHDELRRAQAHFFGVPFVTLTHDDIEPEALFLIPEPLARTRSIVAFRNRGGEAHVALLDLADLERLDFLREQHFTVRPHLTTGESIKRALLVYQKKLKEQFGALARGGAHAVEALLHHALLSRASHVHLDFKTAGLLVRYRIKGLLHEAMTLPKEAAHIFGRLKELAGLSATLHVPQEGAFKIGLGEHEARVRVHAHPAQSGERMVMHLLPTYTTRKGFTLESLGLHGEPLECAHKLINRSHGLVAVVGPAQSGKTTLLYTLTDLASEPHRVVMTVEDTVESVLPHALQQRVRSDVGLTTAALLRATLKQDPDVVMVGDVREREVAALATGAAARGVLVFAGVESTELFDGMATPLGSITTRLAARVCGRCKETYKLARAESAPFEGKADFGRVLAALRDEGVVAPDTQWKEVQFARAGVGCRECEGGYLPRQTGKGLVGVQEVSVGGETPLTLIEDGLFKAAAGITSIEEVFRLVQDSQE